MIVCLCHRVSEHAISCEVRAGCASFDELQSRLGVATACGACADCAQEVFERACSTSGPTPPLPAHSPASHAGRRVVAVAQIGAA
jgi:bacterioferritin-associated ferredoxin